MQSILRKIQLYRKKGEAPHTVQEVQAVEGYGLEGDRHCMEKKRQISITDEKIVAWIKEQPIAGLCFRKFSANLILDSMQGEAFHVGDMINVGKDTVFCVTDIHKVCFQDECQLFQSDGECRLQGGILFAKSVRAGQIRTGDSVCIVTEAGKGTEK